MNDHDAARADRSRPVPPRSPGATGDPLEPGGRLDRRAVLSGLCLLTVPAAVASCGDRDQPKGPAPGTRIGSLADVPAGGGAVFPEHRVVVTQPAQGTFHAFSAICTHQGCTVAEIADGTINCPCHGSRFDVTDGSVVRGPADEPLPEVDIAVEGSSITLGEG